MYPLQNEVSMNDRFFQWLWPVYRIIGFTFLRTGVLAAVRASLSVRWKC